MSRYRPNRRERGLLPRNWGDLRDDVERRAWFAEKWTPEPNTGCWLWLQQVNTDGYGWVYFGDHRKGARAHRFSFELHVGPIPAGMQILHRCDTPGCVNPQHLRLGTMSENIAEMWQKGRRQARMLTAFGETLSVADWARRLGVRRRVITQRIDNGWTPEETVTLPASKDAHRRKRMRQVA